MLTGSVKQLVGKVHKVQYDLMHKPSSLTFNFNTRNKQLDAEIFGKMLKRKILFIFPLIIYTIWLFCCFSTNFGWK